MKWMVSEILGVRLYITTNLHACENCMVTIEECNITEEEYILQSMRQIEQYYGKPICFGTSCSYNTKKKEGRMFFKQVNINDKPYMIGVNYTANKDDFKLTTYDNLIHMDIMLFVNNYIDGSELGEFVFGDI